MGDKTGDAEQNLPPCSPHPHPVTYTCTTPSTSFFPLEELSEIKEQGAWRLHIPGELQDSDSPKQLWLHRAQLG